MNYQRKIFNSRLYFTSFFSCFSPLFVSNGSFFFRPTQCCSYVTGHCQTTNVWMGLMWAVDQKPIGVRNSWNSAVYMYLLSQLFRREQRLFPSHFGLGWPHVLHALNASDAVVRNFAAGGSDVIPETSWTLIAEPTGLTYNKNPTKWSGENSILQQYRPEWMRFALLALFIFLPLSLWLRMCSRMDAKFTNSDEESSTVSVQDRSSRVLTENLKTSEDNGVILSHNPALHQSDSWMNEVQTTIVLHQIHFKREGK